MRAGLPAIALVIFSLFMLWAAYGLGLGQITRPGPGFFPFWIAFSLILAALALLAPSVLHGESPTEAKSRPVFRGVGTLLAVLAVMSVFGVLLDYLGFFLTTVTFLAFCWLVIDRLPPVRGTLLILGSSIAAYLLFDRLLGVHFPRGFTGF